MRRFLPFDNLKTAFVRAFWALGANMLLLGFFFPYFFTARYPLSATLPNDNATQNFPFHYFIADSQRKGLSARWCPYMAGGFPLFAEPQSQFFYPLNTARWPFPSPFTSFKFQLLLHYFLALNFMFAYGIFLRLSPPFAAVSALIFSCSGFMVGHIVQSNMTCATAWMPLVLLTFHAFVLSGKGLWALTCSAVFALQLLAGHPQISLYTGLAMMVIALFPNDLGDGCVTIKIKRAVQALAFWLAIVCGGFALAGVQTIPTYFLTQESIRVGQGPNFVREFGCRPLEVLGNFVPFLPLQFRFEKTGYAGLVPLALGLTCLLIKIKGRFFPLYFLGALGLVLSITYGNPLYDLLSRVPIFKDFRFHGRMSLLYAFAVSLLAGRGLQALASRRRKEGFLLSVICVILIGLLSAVSLCWRPIIRSILPLGGEASLPLPPLTFQFAILAVASLAGVGLSLQRLPPALIGGAISLLALLEVLGFNHQTVIRPLVTREEYLHQFKVYKIVAPLKEKAPKPRKLLDLTGHPLATNVNLLFEIPMSTEYTPLIPQWTYVVIALLRQPLPPHIYGMFGVRFIASRRRQDLDAWMKKLTEVDDIVLYENPAVLPQAFLVSKARYVGDFREFIDLLMSGRFDPCEEAILNEPISALDISSLVSPREEREIAKVKVVRDERERTVVLARTSRWNVLILNASYSSGWKVYIDGKKGQVVRVNGILRGTIISPGTHLVEFLYDPEEWKMGARTTLKTSILWGLLFVLFFCRRRKQLLLDHTGFS